MKNLNLINGLSGIIIFTVLLGFKSFAGITSDDPVLLKVNDREITVSEFEYVYSKNNLNPQVMDPRSVEEYLELFINFNLKVYEAIQLGLDTHETFINELAGYRQQLAQPYLNDQEVTDHLLEEAIERLQWDVRASHILIYVEEHADPADTLKAWSKIMNIRERILGGESFSALAVEYSDDPSAKGQPATASRPAMRGNSGDLGYFSVLDMVYPFENAVYNTPVNEISMPVRTNFGYHIIKVADKLPAMGRATVAHIMVNVAADAPEENQQQAKSKIDEIYQKVLDGEDFGSLAERFSDDKASGRRGGELPAFTSTRMVPEFIKAIADLDEPGQISEPVRTQFGWHLIKLRNKSLPSDDEVIVDLKNRITRDNRAKLSQNVVLQRIKNENNFNEYNQNLEIFFEKVDDSIFQGRWDKSVIDGNNELLFSFADNYFTQQNFANYLANVQSMRTPESLKNYINTMYLNFRNQSLLEYEESQLEDKYPEFRRIMKEYHDGILLFELTDQKVWSKAMQDTIGLREFFQNNIENYMWNDRFDAEIYTFNSERVAKSGRRQIRRAQRRNISHEELMNEFNSSSQLEVSSEKGLMEKKQNPLLSKISKRQGVSNVIKHGNNYAVVRVNEFLPSQPKKMNEVRGLVIADYQNYLEEKWVEELRSKYEYSVNPEAIELLLGN